MRRLWAATYIHELPELRRSKCSPDTALRDITDLIDRGILQKDEAGGRSTSYSLTEVE
jgi:predicted HTH transcriptional regulator